MTGMSFCRNVTKYTKTSMLQSFTPVCNYIQVIISLNLVQLYTYIKSPCVGSLREHVNLILFSV